MISFDDCCAFCGVNERTVLAIAEHEHIPAASAAGMAELLLCQPDGCRAIAAMIADDIGVAIQRSDWHHAEDLVLLLREFVASHPDALRSVRARARLAAAA